MAINESTADSTDKLFYGLGIAYGHTIYTGPQVLDSF